MRKIKGYGGGDEGSSSSRTPVEADDSLQSKQYARVIDAISEGEVEGLVAGYQSIELDGTPLQNPDGSYNFSGFAIETRNGTQDQTYIPGFPSAESSVNVGAEVKYVTPVTRQITNENANKVRVTVTVPKLTSTNVSTGDTTGNSVTIGIDLQTNGGGFVPALFRNTTVVGNLVQVSATVVKMLVVANNVSIGISWVGRTSIENYYPVTNQKVSYVVQRRLAGSSDAWVNRFSGSFSGDAIVTYVDIYDGGRSTERVVKPPTGSNYFTDDVSSGLLYEYQIVATSVINTNAPTLSSATSSSVVAVEGDIISGKASSPYQREYTIALSGTGPWDIRVKRLTPDSTSQYSLNETYWASYTEVIDSKLRYPNTAISALSIDASQFSSVPTRAYHMRGLKIKVPSNYDPITREYTGVWDGTFQVAWSDNPAWCFYDLATNTRYGLGGFISEAQVDKATLYTIGQYCDEMVQNGFGALEPRYTCNMYLQTREEAYKVLTDMASIFSGMLFWSGGGLTTTIDAPSDFTYQFTNGNVTEEGFTYSGSAKNSRHTVALVAYNDTNNKYERKVEYVDDPEGIAKWGVRETEVVSIGCTSRGQAHRHGKRILLTERYLTETVTFTTSLEGAMWCYPGAVIKVMDNNRAGTRLGGRVSAATVSQVTIDSSVTFELGKTYTLSIIKPDGIIEEQGIANTDETTNVVTVNTDFTEAPNAQSVWVISSSDIVPQQFKVLSAKEKDGLLWEVTALQYNPSKYSAIESNLNFQPLHVTGIASAANILPPSTLTLAESLYQSSVDFIDTRVTATWSAVTNPYLSTYQVSWRYENGNWAILPETKTTTVDIQPVIPGNIDVRVSAKNILGVISAPITKSILVLGKTVPPSDVTNFHIQIIDGAAFLSWGAVSDLDMSHYTIRYTPSVVDVTWSGSSVLVPKVSSPATSAVAPALNGTYLIKAVDTSDNESVNATMIITNVPQLDGFNAVEALIEQTDFPGVKTNTVVYGSTLQLGGSTMSSWTTLSAVDLLVLGTQGFGTGEYLFESTVDLGSVFTSRLTSKIKVFGTNLRGTLDSWASLNLVNPLAGTDNSTWDIFLYVRTTEDDTTATPTWSNWLPFVVGDYTARGLQFKVELVSYVSYITPVIEELEVSIDMPDRVDGQNDLVCTTSGYSITYSPAFKNNPAVAISAQGLTTGDYYVISSKSSNGFTINFYNASAVAIERTFDWVARGYGYVT